MLDQPRGLTGGAPLAERSVTALRGVGPKLASKLAALGITTVQDLLFHLPLRYQDRTRITPIGALTTGQDAVIEGEIRVADVVFGRRRSLVCRLQDGTGTATLRFFHFSAVQRAQLAPGVRLRCYGEPRRGAGGLEFYHPEYRLSEEAAPVSERLTAVYPSTEGLQQASWRKLCAAALVELDTGTLRDLLPEPLPLREAPVHLAEALRYLHCPPRDANLAQLAAGAHPCQRRLAFEELVAHQLSLLSLRAQLQRHGAPPLLGPADLIRQFLSQLPFTLTAAQQQVAREVADDLRKPIPMLRLVQGDVGSGKTVIAALAALRAVASGHQVAMMAPTELLAEQHLANFRRWFEPLGVRVGWLAGKVKGKEREATRAALADGSLQVAVGTHALLQESVTFAQLGLAIIDEQHRFGVHQRLQLQQKGLAPHQLIMTATPIPRTLAMSAYADLDTSIIDELPPGRQPVQTVAIGSDRRSEVTERIRHVCRQGRQVYWVCTLIEESEQLQAQAAETRWSELTAALPELRVALLHGRMKAAIKAEVMASFKAGEIDLLVATTVIEVGVDVPNASLMVIENPERLGLAQLHQLRGRVGRGTLESFCVLLYQTPLSRTGRARLQVLRDSNDGFEIAERDLELRGPGEVLGTRQTGLLTLKLADLQRDADLLPLVREYAQGLATHQPQLAAALVRRWLPDRERYARV